MVYDKIDNIETYKGLSEDIYEGLQFLKNATLDLAVGVHEINPRVKAIVSEYETMQENENGYEAHREWIDIQYLISGQETLRCLPLEFLNETKRYDASKDAAFFEENDIKGQELLLGNGYFALLFPQDGHMPCLSSGKNIRVLKVVMKIKE